MRRNLCVLAFAFLGGAWAASSRDTAVLRLLGRQFGAGTLFMAGLLLGTLWIAAALRENRVLQNATPLADEELDWLRGSDPPAPVWVSVALVLLFACAGYARYGAWRQACAGDAPGLCGRGGVRIRGMVVDEPVPSRCGTSTRFRMSLTGWAPEGGAFLPARGLVAVTLAGARDDVGDVEREDPRLEYGDEVELAGVAVRPSPARNPGGFDYRGYLESQGVSVEFRGHSGALKVVRKGLGNPAVRAALRFRRRLEAVARTTLPDREAALLTGVVLGARSELDAEVMDGFRHAGIYHVLAVSGLHVGFVCSSVTRLTSVVGVRGTKAALLSALIVLFYSLVTGMRPSVLRAAVMAIAGLGAPFVNRRKDPLTALALAALMVVYDRPGSVSDAGFQLSFGATLGLIVLTPYFRAVIKRWRPSGGLASRIAHWIAESLAVTLGAQTAVFPIVLRQFSEISLVSVVTNPLVVPLVGVSVTVGSAALVAGSVWNLLGLVVNLPNRLILKAVTAMALGSASLPFAYVFARPPGPLEVAVYYGTILLIMKTYPSETLENPKRRRAFVMTSLTGLAAVVVVYLAMGAPTRELEVTFLDVGCGDALVVTVPGGVTTIIDAGGGSSRDRASSGDEVARFLAFKGIRRLELAIVSHFHEDHCGGMADVLRRVHWERLMIPPVGEDFERVLPGPLLDLVKGAPTKVVVARKGMRWTSGGVAFQVLRAGEGATENDRSVVLRVSYGGVRFLFTGDIGWEAETEMVRESAALSADVLKAAHHGSNGSSSDDFLAAVAPDVCVVSVGPNSQGLPGAGAMARLKRACPAVLRTDEVGAVTVSTDGVRIRVRTMTGGALVAEAR